MYDNVLWKDVVCPHCGASHHMKIPLLNYYNPIIMICESDDVQGCGSTFAYEPVVTMDIKYYKVEEVKGITE